MNRIIPKVDIRQTVVMILGCFPRHLRLNIHWILRIQLIDIIHRHLSIRHPRCTVVTMTMCSWNDRVCWRGVL